jgi:hypothetical protein
VGCIDSGIVDDLRVPTPRQNWPFGQGVRSITRVEAWRNGPLRSEPRAFVRATPGC